MRLSVKISLFIFITLMYAGCSKKVEQNFGIEISNTVISPMTELLNNADSFLDKNVVIKFCQYDSTLNH